MAEEEENDSKFEVLGLIGQGAFGKVFLLEDDKGTQVWTIIFNTDIIQHGVLHNYLLAMTKRK